MHIRVFLTILIAISVVLLPADLLKSQDYEGYIEDLIEIQVIDNKVIAFRDGKDPVSFRLPRIESVLLKLSKGNLGAVLTDSRFLAISMTSKGWHETSLKMNEAFTGSVVLSNAIALLVTSERAIGFDYITNAFVEQRLLLEKPVASDANMYVAAVVSTKRAYGLAMGSKAFVEKRLGMHERFESLEAKSRLATVRTSERVLSFQASDSSWHEVDRPFFEWSKPEVGGCSYNQYKGTATITSVMKTNASIAQRNRAGYEGYEVEFLFTPDERIKESWAIDRIKKEQRFRLANSWYPGEEYLRKYQIAPGKKYQTVVNIIKKGTCSPIVFSFDRIDETDYFETRK
jgi:hypothetical protein